MLTLQTLKYQSVCFCHESAFLISPCNRAYLKAACVSINDVMQTARIEPGVRLFVTEGHKVKRLVHDR